jgi:drug/metabolite transporter (DMT)-like permease
MGVFLLILGVIACSVAGVLIRVSETPALLIAAYRLLIASVIMLPLFLRAKRKHREVQWSQVGGAVLIPAVFMSLHFWAWNSSVHMTPVVNASLIVNMVPVAMPFVIWIMARERINASEVVGTVVALMGSCLLAISDYHFDVTNCKGDLLALFAMIAMSLYLAWNRRCMHLPSMLLYLSPLYLVAGLICMAVSAVVYGNILVIESREWSILLGLALIPTVIGHSLLNYSMRHLRSQTVAVVNVGQFIPAGLLAWILLAEAPRIYLMPASVLVTIGAVVVIRAGGQQKG